MSDFFSFDTLSLHAGQTLDPEFGSRAQPIHQTTSYVFSDTDTASSLFLSLIHISEPTRPY